MFGVIVSRILMWVGIISTFLGICMLDSESLVIPWTLVCGGMGIAAIGFFIRSFYYVDDED